MNGNAEGGKRGGRGKKNLGDNITKVSRGTDPTYLVRRLKRDRPDIAERLAGGEFKSARAAAIAAGIVKPKTPHSRKIKGIAKSPSTSGPDGLARAPFPASHPVFGGRR